MGSVEIIKVTVVQQSMDDVIKQIKNKTRITNLKKTHSGQDQNKSN